MEAQQESSVSTSVFSSTEASKVKPQPCSELVKELYITPNEDKLAIFEKNYRLMYDAVTTTTQKFKETKKAMIKNLKSKSTQTNIKLSNFKVKPNDNLTQILQQIELKKQELQDVNEKIQEQIAERKVRDKEMGLLKADINKGDKRVSELMEEVNTWRNKFEEKIVSTRNFNEMWRKGCIALQDAEMKLNQVQKMRNELRTIILKFLLLIANDDANSGPHTPKTKKVRKVKILREKLEQFLNELVKFPDEPTTSHCLDI